MKLLAVIAVVVVLIIAAGGRFEFQWWTSSGASNIPAARDVNRLVDAGHDVRLRASYQNLTHMVTGINTDTPAFEAALEHQVPGVASRLAEDSESVRLRVLATNVETQTGAQLREVLARTFLAQRIMCDDLVAALVAKRNERAAFAQWVHRYNQLSRWLVSRLNGVVAAAPPEDQAAVAAALHRL